MRVTIERSAFLKALTHVQSVVERRNTIPILSNVLLQAGGGQLKLTATDLDIEIVESVPAEVSKSGATTVPAHMLYDIVRKLPDGAQLELEQAGDGQRVSIFAGRSRFALQALPHEDFPDLAAGDFPYTFAIAGADLSSVRTILYSAAPMPSTVLLRAIEVFDGCGFVNLFGQTEICMFCLSPLQHKPSGSEAERRQLTSVGQPYPNLEAKILDDDGNECPVGVAGEIVARSGAMFRGYWNNSVATVETLRNGWVHTGDMGRIDEDGFLYIVDRTKDMIVTGGENVYPAEVESALMSHPAIADVAVIGVPHEKWGETVKAIVVKKADVAVTEAEIIEFSKGLLARFKCPTSVDWIDALPRNPSGKILKKDLRAPYWEGRERMVN